MHPDYASSATANKSPSTISGRSLTNNRRTRDRFSETLLLSRQVVHYAHTPEPPPHVIQRHHTGHHHRRPRMSSFANHFQSLPGTRSMSALTNSARVGARTARPQRDSRDKSLLRLLPSPPPPLPRSPPLMEEVAVVRGVEAKRSVRIKGSQRCVRGRLSVAPCSLSSGKGGGDRSDSSATSQKISRRSARHLNFREAPHTHVAEYIARSMIHICVETLTRFFHWSAG